MANVSKVSNPGTPARSSRRVELSPKFEEALVYATCVHGGQLRKQTKIPYVAHILGVAAIALEYGATEQEAIAALLHDAVEDAGGAKRLRDIQRRFGKAVAQLVAGCTDTDQVPKPPWLQRKKAYVARVRHAGIPVKLVSASDKLHNARAILADYREQGDKLWGRFNGGKDGTLWYYRALVKAFGKASRIRTLVEELDRVVSELEAVANNGKRVERPPRL
jgi:(p)ppGpp synthase/HD superfamily hydrolase